jgi:hypothetical protein
MYLTKDELPFQFFCVKNDGTEEFKEYIKWLNKEYGSDWDGSLYEYYGFDNGISNSGTYCRMNPKNFQNNPKVFETAKEFMDIITKKKELPEKFSVYASTLEEAIYITQKQEELCGHSILQINYNIYYRFNLNGKNRIDKIGWNGEPYFTLPSYGIKHEFSFEEFKSYFETNREQNMEQKKIIGYKLNGTVDRKTVDRFLGETMSYCGDVLLSGKSKHCNEMTEEEKSVYFTRGHVEGSLVKKCRQACVLDLWFTPIYEPEKPREIAATLSNNKLINITKEGVIVEGKLVKIKYIESLYSKTKYSETNTFGDTGWNIRYNTFDIGCYKNLNKKDLEYILRIYKSLQ